MRVCVFVCVCAGGAGNRSAAAKRPIKITKRKDEQNRMLFHAVKKCPCFDFMFLFCLCSLFAHLKLRLVCLFARRASTAIGGGDGQPRPHNSPGRLSNTTKRREEKRTTIGILYTHSERLSIMFDRASMRVPSSLFSFSSSLPPSPVATRPPSPKHAHHEATITALPTHTSPIPHVFTSLSSFSLPSDWFFLSLSYFHTLFILFLGSALLLAELPTLRVWQNNERWLTSGTTWYQQRFFLVSIVYYLLDILGLLFTGRHKSARRCQLYVAHHLLAMASLITSIVTLNDGFLILVCLIFSELSNPPLLIHQMDKHANRLAHIGHAHNQGQGQGVQVIKQCPLPGIAFLKRLVPLDLSLVHIVLFIGSRFFCLQFTAHAVFPFSKLPMTKTAALLLLIINAAFLWDYIQYLCKRSGAAKKKRVFFNHWPL